jgi:hypothetical protein
MKRRHVFIIQDHDCDRLTSILDHREEPSFMQSDIASSSHDNV